MAIEIQGDTYDFRFTDRRIDIIEKATGKPIVANFIQNGGVVSLADLRVMFIQGLKQEDGPYIIQKTGEQAFKEVLEEYGYMALNGMIIEALERDCPFFFRES